MKREASKQPFLTNYVTKRRLTGMWELKQTTTTRIIKTAIESHQMNALLSGAAWKLSDLDPREKPADLMAVFPDKGEMAVVVFMQGSYYFVIPQIWNAWPHTSFTKEDLQILAFRIVHSG